MARFSDFDSKEEAYRAIAQMGNSVLRGTPLEVVVRRESQGANAHDGGQYDWTTKGSLVSTVIDEAIFSLPVGKLSRILEDDKGFHIVRVLERKDAGCVPFQQTQREIRETLKDQHRDTRVKEYLEGLQRDTYVWNYFDQANDASHIAREPSQTR